MHRSSWRLTKLYAKYIEPWSFCGRRMRRLRRADQGIDHALTKLSIYLGQTGACSSVGCVQLIRRYDNVYHRMRHGNLVQPSDKRMSPKLKCLLSSTLQAIDLRDHFQNMDYLALLRRTSANFVREATRSGRLGFQVQEFHPANYTVDILAIHRSKKWRSFGPVLDAFLMRLRDLGGAPAHFKHIEPPACAYHWEKMIGVFLPCPGHLQGALQTNQQLVGYARVCRIGNTVSYRDFIGHANYVREGVMKQLHLYVMQWLLDRTDPCVQGVDQLTYGAVERGGDGLYAWKKRALFEPYFVALEEQQLPHDFNPAEYLRLNPDLKERQSDLAAHYLWHGRVEKRLYKTEVPADFDPIEYLALNPDLQCSARDADVHYTRHGRHENRPYRIRTDRVHPAVGHMSYG